MPREYRPGMKMYEVVWERAGKRVGTYCVHAANEADALSHAEAFFAEHPEHDFPRSRDGATARAGLVGGVDGTIFTNFEDMPDA